MADQVAEAGVFVMLEIGGTWVIWSSFMAIKFMIEDAQHQRAAFSVLHDTQVGGFIVIPVILSVIWTVISVVLAAAYE